LSISEKKNLGQMSAGSVSKHSEHKPKLGTTYQQKWLPCGSKDGFSNVRRYQQEMNSPDGVGSGSKQSKCLVNSDSAYKQDFPPLSGHSGSEGLYGGRIQIGQILGGRTADATTLHHDLSEKLIISIPQSETQLPSQSAKKDEPAPSKGPESSTGHNNSKHSEDSVVLPFDICPPKTGTSVALKPGLFEKNRGRRNAIKQSMEGQNGIVLRSGMIHLKGYISLRDQVMIVKSCRDVGLGPGGFYQPGYRDGGKLQLWMTCLGKNWDPEARKYGDNQPFDGAKPPIIPDKFYQLVVKAITDSHSIIQKNSKASNVENILPRMSPDICLVNFYTVNGRLGLHQVCYKPSYTYYSSLSDFLQLLLLEV
jgi:alkylated DNA repair dioxygenase AlkB